MKKTFDDLIWQVKHCSTKKVAVACAQDDAVLEAVKVSPNMKSNARSNTSYIQKLQPTHNATHRKEEAITIPILPLYNACSGWANLTAEVAEMTMARALAPKQILNIKGENP